MKYILDKEELEHVKTKLLSIVSDFFIEIAKNKKDTMGHVEANWTFPYDKRSTKVIYINLDTFSESIETMREKLAETINNL